MNKKNKIRVTILVLFLSCILITIEILTYKPSPNKIFYNAIESIVELKACSDKMENYGTAVVIGKEGLLATNAHVVTYKSENEYRVYDKCFIRFATENEYREVSVVKYDIQEDIAILKCDSKDINFKEINIGDGKNVYFGNSVYAIGNTENGGLSITKGIVSIPHIVMEYDNIKREVIQSDLVIASGNSGGALLDEYGRLIGITSFRRKDNYGNVVYGVAYSIPIEKIIKYIES